MEKYKFLLDQGKKANPFPEEFRLETFKVSGCQAQVWLVPFIDDKLLSFHSDSDAFIAKGMITILCDIFSDQEAKIISNANFKLLETLKLDTLLTDANIPLLDSISNFKFEYKIKLESV